MSDYHWLSLFIAFLSIPFAIIGEFGAGLMMLMIARLIMKLKDKSDKG